MIEQTQGPEGPEVHAFVGVGGEVAAGLSYSVGSTRLKISFDPANRRWIIKGLTRVIYLYCHEFPDYETLARLRTKIRRDEEAYLAEARPAAELHIED